MLRFSSLWSPFLAFDEGISQISRFCVWDKKHYLADSGEGGLREPLLLFQFWFVYVFHALPSSQGNRESFQHGAA